MGVITIETVIFGFVFFLVEFSTDLGLSANLSLLFIGNFLSRFNLMMLIMALVKTD